jgi:hypothetical protein
MSDQHELISAVGVDYTRLRDLLANGQWQEAGISIHRGSRRLSFIIHALLWHRARNCNL